MTSISRWLALAVLLTGGPAVAQPQNALPTYPPDGTEVFRGLFAANEVEPLSDWSAVFGPAGMSGYGQDRLIVVCYGLPARTTFGRRVRHIQSVLRNGGAVLILTDEPGDVSVYLPDAPADSLTMSEQKVVAARPGRCFQKYAGSPFAAALTGRDLPADVRGGLPPVEQVATNHPAALTLAAPSKYAQAVVAGFQPDADCRLGGPTGPKLARNQGLMTVGVAGPDDPIGYRCMVIADPSIFMNQMLAASDPAGGGPQNLLFAHRVVNWLRGPERRSRCLFLDHGSPQAVFDTLPPDLPPLPPIPNPLDPKIQSMLVDRADEALAAIQDQNGFNRLIFGSQNDPARAGAVFRWLAVAAAASGLVWVLIRLWVARHRPSLVPPPKPPATDAPPGSFADRRRELVRSGDLSGPARGLIAQLFAAQGAAAPPTGRSDLPPVEVTGPESAALTTRLRVLWRVASGLDPRPVRAARWRELEPMIAAVRAAAAAGRWRVLPPEDR